MGIQNAFGVLYSLILQPEMGFERLGHYQERSEKPRRGMVKQFYAVGDKNFERYSIKLGVAS